MVAGGDAQHDIPQTSLALPADVWPIPFLCLAKFNLRCEVDLKTVAFGLRHAEYNPRKHGSITVRIFEPRATALVRASGVVSVTGPVDMEVLKTSAKKIARLIQRAGCPDAKFAGYEVSTVLAKLNVGFPVRLDALATKWRKNAMYEPEFYSGCVFRSRNPRSTFLITAGGKVVISGTRTVEATEDAARRIYAILLEFQT